jgi:hypothetical protein
MLLSSVARLKVRRALASRLILSSSGLEHYYLSPSLPRGTVHFDPAEWLPVPSHALAFIVPCSLHTSRKTTLCDPDNTNAIGAAEVLLPPILLSRCLWKRNLGR